MRIDIRSELNAAQKEIVFRLWNAEYPASLSYRDVSGLDDFIGGVTERSHFLIFDENENLRGWLMTFTRDGERWFSIIIDSSQQKKGYGTALLNEIKKYETDINGWVIETDDQLKSNGEKYVSPIAFYEKNGFSILRDVRFEKPDVYFVKINRKS